MKITSLIAREILDSRGNPTVRVWLKLDDGSLGIAAVPSGASTGTHEALELRDGDKERYGGKGVMKAVQHVNEDIARAVAGQDFDSQRALDQFLIELDGTKNKSKLGANAILGVSMAFAVAAAKGTGAELYAYLRTQYSPQLDGFALPTPMMNVINGGAHADSGLAFQEFMVIPHADTLAERVRKGEAMFHALKKVLQAKEMSIGVGDEGGFAPHLHNEIAAFDVLMEAIRVSGLQAGSDVSLAIDAAATEFYNAQSNMYQLTEKSLEPNELVEFYKELVAAYPLVSIEDGLAEDDWTHWKMLTDTIGKGTQLVGDDLFVTNPERLAKGIQEHVGNAVLIKLNQIGTVSETLDCCALAHNNGYALAISHRSGETADTFIADLAVATNAQYIKTSCSRSERVEKYNRLMEIESLLA